MLEAEQLRNFLHVIDAGSLSAAASRAHVTQPALSRQIGLLEDDVGAQLFERTGRGMRPTVDGRRLEQRVRPLIKQFESLQRDFSKAPIAGPLAVAVTPSIGMEGMARLISAFRREYPDADLRLAVVLSGVMPEAIVQGKYDLGLLYSPVEHPGLETTELLDEAAYLIQKRRRDCKGERITLDEVLERHLILPSSQFGLRGLLEAEAERRGRRLRPEIEIDSVQLALALVRQGVGDFVLTERALADVPLRTLEALRIERPRLARTALLGSTSSALSRPVARAFWEFVVEHGL